MGFKLTKEQENIISSIDDKSLNTIKINAFAGTGKTSTLIEIANACRHMDFLYLAFNKAIAEEAKSRFTSNVSVYTTHGLAYTHSKKFLDMDKLATKYKAMEIKNILEISSYNEANLVNLVFTKYCQSRFSYLTDKEVKLIIKSDVEMDITRKKTRTPYGEIASYVNKLVEKFNNRELPATHDYYLKYFQVNAEKFDIKTDCILLDEAQDTNDAVLSIVEKLNTRKIIVGDRHQQIYGFRGSLNAMQKLNSDKNLYLSSSFRITDVTALKASQLLSSFKGEPVQIKAFKREEEKGGNQVCFIARTNAGLIKLIDKYKESNFTTVREPKEIFRTPMSILNLYSWFKNKSEKAREYINDKYLLEFKSKQEFLDYSKAINDIELLSAIDMVNIYGASLVNLKRAATEKFGNKNAKVIFTTAHTAKGLEWENVIVEDDFPDILESMVEASIYDMKSLRKCINEGMESTIHIEQDINLLYVAMTRAKNKLRIESKNGAYIGKPDEFLNKRLSEIRLKYKNKK